MGLGRRDFLKLMGTTVASIIASPILNSVIITDDLYFNRKLGIALKKPSGWYFNDVLDMGEVGKGQILDLEDKELAKKILDDVPIVCMTKVPLAFPGQDFTPGINVYLDVRSNRNSSTEESDFVKRLFTNIQEPLRSVRKDILANGHVCRKFKVLAKEECFQVSKYPAVHYVSSFLFEHQEMKIPVKVRMSTLLVMQDHFYYWFRMYDAPSRGKKFIVDFSPFINSIVMV